MKSGSMVACVVWASLRAQIKSPSGFPLLEKMRNAPWFLLNLNLFESLSPSVFPPCCVSVVKRCVVAAWYWFSGEGEGNLGKRSRLLLSNNAKRFAEQNYWLMLQGNDKYIELSLDFSCSSPHALHSFTLSTSVTSTVTSFVVMAESQLLLHNWVLVSCLFGSLWHWLVFTFLSQLQAAKEEQWGAMAEVEQEVNGCSWSILYVRSHKTEPAKMWRMSCNLSLFLVLWHRDDASNCSCSFFILRPASKIEFFIDPPWWKFWCHSRSQQSKCKNAIIKIE